jgi:hypothetical protein
MWTQKERADVHRIPVSFNGNGGAIVEAETTTETIPFAEAAFILSMVALTFALAAFWYGRR